MNRLLSCGGSLGGESALIKLKAHQLVLGWILVGLFVSRHLSKLVCYQTFIR